MRLVGGYRSFGPQSRSDALTPPLTVSPILSFSWLTVTGPPSLSRGPPGQISGSPIGRKATAECGRGQSWSAIKMSVAEWLQIGTKCDWIHDHSYPPPPPQSWTFFSAPSDPLHGLHLCFEFEVGCKTFRRYMSRSLIQTIYVIYTGNLVGSDAVQVRIGRGTLAVPSRHSTTPNGDSRWHRTFDVYPDAVAQIYVRTTVIKGWPL